MADQKYIQVPVPENMDALSDDILNQYMKIASQLKLWIKGVEELAYERLTHKPDAFPDYILAPGRRSRDWIDERHATEAMARAGINDPYERKLLSPAKAEEKVSEAQRKVLADGYVWTDGKPIMKPRTEESIAKRDAVKSDLANPDDFSDW